jgi:hypothetical protein
MASRVLRCAAAVAALGSLLSGCASAPRAPAGRIASAGTNLTSALAANTNRIAKDVALDPAIDAFYRIYAICDALFLRKPPPAECPPDLTEIKTSQASAKNLREYAQILRFQAAAFNALGSAYLSLKSESEYDAAADASDAIDGAARAVTTLAGAALAPAKLLPIADLMKTAAGGIAAGRQKQRLMNANDRLQAVVSILLVVMREQQTNLERQLDVTERHRALAMQALVKEGVVSRADSFAKMLKDADIAIATAGAAKIDSSPVLRASVDAALAQRAIDRLQNRYQDYETSIAALEALVAMHDQFRASGSVNTTLVESLTARLAIEAAPAPATTTPAPAAPAAPAASASGTGKTN